MTMTFQIRGPSPYEDGVIVDDFWLPCFPADSDAVQINWSELDRTKIVEPAVTMVSIRAGRTGKVYHP